MAKGKSKPKKNKKKGKSKLTWEEKRVKKLEKIAERQNKNAVEEKAIAARCHAHPLRPVAKFKAGGTLWAGGLAAVRQAIKNRMVKPELIIDLSGSLDDLTLDPIVEGNERAKTILPERLFAVDAPPTALLRIDWDDGGVPYELNALWWATLAGALIKCKGDVLLCCQGGHGRTGTALSILLTLFGVCGESGQHKDAVLYLRESYCEQAVETQAQITYVEEMADTKTLAEASDPYAGWWTHTTKGTETETKTLSWDDDGPYQFDQGKPSVNGTGKSAHARVVASDTAATSSIVTQALRKAADDQRVARSAPSDDEFIEEMERRHDNPQDFVGVKGA